MPGCDTGGPGAAPAKVAAKRPRISLLVKYFSESRERRPFSARRQSVSQITLMARSKVDYPGTSRDWMEPRSGTMWRRRAAEERVVKQHVMVQQGFLVGRAVSQAAPPAAAGPLRRASARRPDPTGHALPLGLYGAGD